MVRFSDEWLQELLDKNDIVDVVGDYLTLTKKGANYWAPCPWHHERNPSFCVNPAKQMFYCFSCKKGGSAITFVMEHEKMSFPEAVQHLAERVGMQLPEDNGEDDWNEKNERKKHLYAMMRETALFYHNNLETPEGKKAKDYLIKRGVGRQIGAFGLGYAPDSFDTLQKFLSQKGYTVKDMMDGGLVKQGSKKPYDVFRDRVMFPIQNVFGDVIAFGGRVMGDGEPKYLNSSETVIFNKRKNLYALNIVKKQHKLKSLLLVEGYMDVVALAGNGVSSGVASLGTSLTKEQAKLMKRFVSTVYLCYDGDDAGIHAALRGVDILSDEGLDVRVMVLPDGMDPDEFVKKYGRDMFYAQAGKAMQPTEFKLGQIRKEFDLGNMNDKVAYGTKAVDMLKNVKNAIERERYARQVAEETGVSLESVMAQMGMDAEQNRYNLPEKEIELITKKDDDELSLIALLIDHPQKTATIKGLDETVFGKELYKKIFLYIKEQIKRGIIPSNAEIISEFSSEFGEDLGRLIGQKSSVSAADGYGEELIDRIRYDRLRKERDALIKEREGSADQGERAKLLKNIGELNARLYSIKRTIE